MKLRKEVRDGWGGAMKEEGGGGEGKARGKSGGARKR